jgi:hypothetical protein
VAIKIPFLADVTKFLAGTKDLEEALGDVVDSLDDVTEAGDDVDTKVASSLDDVAKAADDASRKVDDLATDLDGVSKVDTGTVESELKEIGTAADTAAEKLDTSFKTAFDTLKREGKTATDKAQKDLKDTGDTGVNTMREFKDEAKSNLSETVSSFDGSASSAVDAIQGTLGGLVAALGPAGVVGVAAAGVGIGMARSLFAKSQEAAEEFRERVLSIFEELRSSGGDISPEFKADALAEIVSDAERLQEVFGSKNLADFQTLLKDTGLSAGELRTYFSGLTGDAGDLATAQSLLGHELETLQALMLDPTASLTEQANTRARIEAISTLKGALDDQGNAFSDARTKQQLLNDLMPESTDATEDQAEATKKAAEALADENEKLRENADLKGDAVISELDMLDAIDDVTKARKDNGKSLDTNTTKGRDNIRAVKDGVDAINEFGDAQISAGKDTDTVNRKLKTQEDALVNKVAKAFGITKKQAHDYIRELGGIPRRKDTDVKVDDNNTIQKTKNRIAGIKGKEVPLTVRPDMPSEAQMQRTINAYYSGLSIKVPVELDRYKSGKAVP